MSAAPFAIPISPLQDDSIMVEQDTLMKRPAAASPSLTGSKSAPAFEMKFLLNESQAHDVSEWAHSIMQIDPNARTSEGTYETTSLYTDTADRDVLHRNAGYRRRKYRARRYADGDVVFLEEKKRRGHRVSKKREATLIDDLSRLTESPATVEQKESWFRSELLDRALRPVCQIDYRRTAFVGGDESDPLRLTLDREIRGQLIDDWQFLDTRNAVPILVDQVVLELKFRGAMPSLFKQLLEAMRLMPTGVSKYRYCMTVLENSGGKTTGGGIDG